MSLYKVWKHEDPDGCVGFSMLPNEGQNPPRYPYTNSDSYECIYSFEAKDFEEASAKLNEYIDGLDGPDGSIWSRFKRQVIWLAMKN